MLERLDSVEQNLKQSAMSGGEKHAARPDGRIGRPLDRLTSDFPAELAESSDHETVPKHLLGAGVSHD